MKKEEFKCVVCRKVFIKERLDEEEFKGSSKDLNDIPENDIMCICKDCFNMSYKKNTINFKQN